MFCKRPCLGYYSGNIALTVRADEARLAHPISNLTSKLSSVP